MSFTKVPDKELFVSEPPPQWFGNPPNQAKSKTGVAWTNANWLKSRFHFSFAEYRDGKSNFGALRVLNDDLVQPSRGFGEHPHANMEIVTYIVEGELSHKDSMGTAETLGRGAVQFMTAGTGVRHQEHNLSPDSVLRFLQIWILPRKSGLKPNYGSFEGDEKGRKNALQHLVSDVERKDTDTPVKINQDINLYVSELEAGKIASLELGKGRQIYMVCVEGDVEVSGAHGKQSLTRHDAAEIIGKSDLKFTGAAQGAHILILEMAQK